MNIPASLQELEILLVEDNPGDVKLVELCIARIPDLCVNLWKARTITEAENFLKETDIQAILLDLGLPDSTGISSVSRMVKSAGDRPVIVLTGLTDDHTVAKALEFGAQDYLSKDRLTPESMRKTLLYTITHRNLLNQMIKDINERKRAEESLLQSEARFRILDENASDIILQLEITPAGVPVIREANNAAFRILGYERDELIGQPVSFINADPDISKAIETRHHDIVSGKKNLFEAKHICKDGTIRVFECSGAEIQIGSKTFAISVERDITERKRAEEELYRLSNMKDEFLSIVSHELRTPLTSILGYLKLLQKQCDGRLDPEQKDYMAIIMRNAGQLLILINTLLDLSRLEKNIREHKPQPLQVLAEIENALKSVKIHTDTSGHSLILDPASRTEDITLFADPKMLNQVLVNFLTNSLKYSPPEKPILVGCRRESKDGKTGTVFWVKDEGKGVPDAKKERIFDRFCQIDPSMTRQTGGLGLGLSIVRDIMELHKGRAWVEDNANKGSTFCAFFPDQEVTVRKIA